MLDQRTHSISYLRSSVLLLPLPVHSKEALVKGSLQMAASPHSTVWDNPAAEESHGGSSVVLDCSLLQILTYVCTKEDVPNESWEAV